MKYNSKMSRSFSIKSLIKDLEPDELREVIIELSKLNKQNKQFLRLYLQSSKDANIDAVVEEAKKEIHSHFYGQSTFPKIDLKNARKTVTEYHKVLNEYPAQIADLKLYYVEIGTALTNKYGDMDEMFYMSMESMFDDLGKIIAEHPTYFKRLKGRIYKLRSSCENIGWGYKDAIHEIVFEMESAVENSENT